MRQREWSMVRARRWQVLGLCLVPAACAGGPRTVDELASLSVAELVDEAVSPAARAEFYVRYDQKYRPRLVQELATRLHWTPEEQAQVLAGQGWVGATPEQIMVAWGKPTDVAKARSVAPDGEQWRYGDADGEHTLVTFAGGRCTGWTQHPAPTGR
jgi:hypothetical protein